MHRATVPAPVKKMEQITKDFAVIEKAITEKPISEISLTSKRMKTLFSYVQHYSKNPGDAIWKIRQFYHLRKLDIYPNQSIFERLKTLLKETACRMHTKPCAVVHTEPKEEEITEGSGLIFTLNQIECLNLNPETY